MVLSYLFLLFLLICKGSGMPRVKRDVSDDPYRLPETISPTHYDIHLTLRETTFTNETNEFTGSVSISITVLNETSQIQLHASSNYITVQQITLDDTEIPSESFSVNETTEILTIDTENPLTYNNSYTLKIDYTGQLDVNSVNGFFKSSYVNENGNTVYLAATQFQATYTRRAFPSWDEPGFKATFQTTIHHPIELTALSNTPGSIVSTNVTENLATTEFEKTPIMSSYLIAFTISDLTCTEPDSIDGTTPHRICSTNQTINKRDWALEIGSKVISGFSEYTKFNYSQGMAKLDQAAVPKKSGAMENWGLVLYSESNLLYDPEESTNSNKQSIAVVIAHELAHQWFGNLLTCKWWSVTFLNEGFAQFYQHHLLSDILPDWELKKQFVLSMVFTSLNTDSYLNALPLQSDASTPTEVSAKFGTISYYKGSSVFRMVEHSLGYENFREGIRSYIDKNQFSNVVPEDLWNALSENVNDTLSLLPADLNTVMQNWVENSGFPLLTVTINGRYIFITQERFLLNGTDTESKWYIPVTYTTSDDVNKFDTTTPDEWLTPTANITITLPEDAEWIIVNNQHAGYYRVNYDTALWNNISRALIATNFSGIPEINRAQIVNDLFTFIKVDKMTYSTAFTLLEFLENDSSYFTWYPVNVELDSIFTKVALHTTLGLAMKEHLLRLSDNLYNSVHITDINEDDQIYTLKQVLATTLACRLGNEKCAEGVREIFSEYRNNGVRPPKNLRSIVYCNGIRHSTNESDWEFLFEAASTSSERSTLITALGCTNDADILVDYLNRSITTGSGVDSDTAAVFTAVHGNHIGVDIAFQFFIEYHDKIYNHLGSWDAVGAILTGITGKFTSQSQLEELKTLISSESLDSSLTEVATTAVSTVEQNLAWIEKYQSDLYQYYNLEEPTTERTTTEDGAASISASIILTIGFLLLNKFYNNIH